MSGRGLLEYIVENDFVQRRDFEGLYRPGCRVEHLEELYRDASLLHASAQLRIICTSRVINIAREWW